MLFPLDATAETRTKNDKKEATPVQQAVPLLEDEEIDHNQKSTMHKFIDHPKIQLLLLIVTLYSLFADDYRVLASDKQLDVVYDVFVMLCLAIFTVEIVIAAVWKPLYVKGYYFYLDIISTASLILDFSPVSTAIIIYG